VYTFKNCQSPCESWACKYRTW